MHSKKKEKKYLDTKKIKILRKYLNIRVIVNNL